MLSPDIVSKIKQTLCSLKDNNENVDYLLFDTNNWEIYPQEFEYNIEYDDYGDIKNEELVIVKDKYSKYVIDTMILFEEEAANDFLSNWDQIELCRNRVEKICPKLDTWAEIIVERNDYYAQIIIDIKEGKMRRVTYYSDEDYNERCIDSDPDNGIFVIGFDEFVLTDCYDDWQGSGDMYYNQSANYNKIRKFVIDSMSEYYHIELFYPFEFLDYLDRD